MAQRDVTIVYDDTPIWFRMAGWLLVGIGGLVLTPLALISRAGWLWVVAAPVIAAGLVLFQTRLHIALEHRTAQLVVTDRVLGLTLRRRRHVRSEVMSVDLERVAGDTQERDSDTWYLRLRLHTRTYMVGRYRDRFGALEARRRLREVLRAGPQPETAAEMLADARETMHSRPDEAAGRYRMGLALLRSGDMAGARRAFEEARSLAEQPLLRRMSEQRLHELDSR